MIFRKTGKPEKGRDFFPNDNATRAGFCVSEDRQMKDELHGAICFQKIIVFKFQNISGKMLDVVNEYSTTCNVSV